MEQIIITNDYGHGGSDPGASGNGVVEKSANLVTGLSCTKELRRHGVVVKETRTTDKDVSLEERVRIANANGSKYFISIHHNAGGGDRGEFIHSIYRGNGQKLAESIGNEMQSRLGQQKKVYEKVGSDNKDYYYVIRNTNMDAVIIEVCFLDNATDVQIADTITEQERNGVVIAHGILKYLGIPIKSDNIPTIPKPLENINIVYQTYTNGRWLPNVTNANDYAGIYGQPVQCLYANLSKGSIRYRVHTKGGSWLPYVTDRSDFAGIYGANIDGLQMELIGLPQYEIKYQVYVNGRWLPWIYGLTDYAGIYGQNIEGIKAYIVKK